MGEQKFRIFNVGTTAIDNLKNIKKTSYKKILNDLKLDENKKYAIFTYHPVTLKESFNNKTVKKRTFLIKRI